MELQHPPVHRAAGPLRPGHGSDGSGPICGQRAAGDDAAGGDELPHPAAPLALALNPSHYSGTARRRACICRTPCPARRSDYAANAGDTDLVYQWLGPVPYATGDAPGYPWPSPSNYTGIQFVRSEIKIADITDGTSNTYMVGEKYLNSDLYFTGTDPADDQSMFSGFNNDNSRSSDPVYGPPSQDMPGYSNEGLWGSAHAEGFNMAFCDGSVRWINYSIDPTTHRYLGNRHDGFADRRKEAVKRRDNG